MGQRSQTYIQFKNKDKGENLFAIHLQWSWGEYQIIRAKQVLDFLKGDLRDSNYSEFNGNGLETACSTRKLLKNLLEFNLLDSTCVRGSDLVLEELTMKFTDAYEGKENFFKLDEMATANLLLGQELPYDYNLDKTYKIDPFSQDNNNGILVIKVCDNDKIKYAFDLLNEEEKFMPITANEYLEYHTNDYDKETNLFYACDEEMEERRNTIVKWSNEITRDYELLTQEEMKEIFDKEYEW